MFKRIVGTLVILMLVGVVVAQENITKTLPPPEKKLEIPPGMEEEWEAFKERYGDAFSKVEWDRTCGCVRHIYGYYDTGKGELKGEEEAEELARVFLKNNAEIFKIDMTQLKFKKVDDWMVDYEQYYGGIPVYGGEVRVVMNGKGVVKTINNNFYPDIDISTTPKITKEEAVEIVTSKTEENLSSADATRRIDKTVLYILPEAKDEGLAYYLTWRVPTHSALYFVDALNGDVLRIDPTVAAYGDDMNVRGTGSGDLTRYWQFNTLLITAVLLLIIVFFVWRWKR